MSDVVTIHLIKKVEELDNKVIALNKRIALLEKQGVKNPFSNVPQNGDTFAKGLVTE